MLCYCLGTGWEGRSGREGAKHVRYSTGNHRLSFEICQQHTQMQLDVLFVVAPHERVPMTALRGYWAFWDMRETKRSCGEREWRQHVSLLHERLWRLSRQPQEVYRNSCKPVLFIWLKCLRVVWLGCFLPSEEHQRVPVCHFCLQGHAETLCAWSGAEQEQCFLVWDESDNKNQKWL